jgi:hypothetical protein
MHFAVATMLYKTKISSFSSSLVWSGMEFLMIPLLFSVFIKKSSDYEK